MGVLVPEPAVREEYIYENRLLVSWSSGRGFRQVPRTYDAAWREAMETVGRLVPGPKRLLLWKSGEFGGAVDQEIQVDGGDGLVFPITMRRVPLRSFNAEDVTMMPVRGLKQAPGSLEVRRDMPLRIARVSEKGVLKSWMAKPMRVGDMTLDERIPSGRYKIGGWTSMFSLNLVPLTTATVKENERTVVDLRGRGAWTSGVWIRVRDVAGRPTQAFYAYLTKPQVIELAGSFWGSDFFVPLPAGQYEFRVHDVGGTACWEGGIEVTKTSEESAPQEIRVVLKPPP